MYFFIRPIIMIFLYFGQLYSLMISRGALYLLC